MKRRAFIASLTGGLLAAPLAAGAQQAGRVWRIGMLVNSDGPLVEVFRQELRNLGYIEGRNILVEYRWHEGDVDRLPALAAELVNLKLDLRPWLSERQPRRCLSSSWPWPTRSFWG